MELLLPGAVLILVSIIGLATVVLWVVALWDVLSSEFRGANDKLVWVLVILFAPFLGAILYFLVGRRNKIKYN